MKKHLLLLVITILATYHLSAQRIYFCDNYTDAGDPIGSNTTRNCPPEGGYVYILYQNGSSNITYDNLYLYVEKLAGDSYAPFDVKTIVPDKTKNWFVYDYQFLTAGDYKVSVKNVLLAELSKEYIKLVPIESSATTNDDSELDWNTDTEDPGNMFYYTYSAVTAAVNVDPISGYLTTPSDVFTIDRTLGGKVYFKVTNNGKKLSTDKLLVYIDKKLSDGTTQIVDTKTYTINGYNSDWASFDFDFYSPGDYVLTVYSGIMTFINTKEINLQYSY